MPQPERPLLPYAAGRPLDCVRDRRSGEREGVLQVAGKVLVEAVGQSLFCPSLSQWVS